MARDVCPQIFAQSRRRWSSNWNSSYLAEFQSINYFRRFSKVIECNCDSFALINRMQMPRCGDTMAETCGGRAFGSYFRDESARGLPLRRSSLLCRRSFQSLSLAHRVSLARSFSPVVTDNLCDSSHHPVPPPASPCGKSNMTARTVDIMENVRRDRHCTHTNSRRLNWTALAVTRTLPKACRNLARSPLRLVLRVAFRCFI